MGFGSTFGGPRYVAIAVEQVQEIEERYGVDIKEVALGTVTAEQMGFSSGGSGGGIGFGFSRKYAVFAFVAKTPGKIIDSDITISRPVLNWFNGDFVLGNSSFFVDNIALGTTGPSANYELSEALTTSNNLTTKVPIVPTILSINDPSPDHILVMAETISVAVSKIL